MAFNVQAALQAGHSPEKIKRYLAKRPDIQIKGADTSTENVPEKQGRGLLDLLSVATSIGGGALGSTIAPGVGTVVGSAGGGALGEWLEQMISGEKTDLKGVANEALWSGGSSLAGLGISKLLSGGAKAAASSSILKNVPKESEYIDKVDDLTSFALGKGMPKGSYMNKAREYSQMAKELGTKRTSLIANTGKSVSTKTFKSTLKRAASDYVDSDEIKDLNVLLNRFPKSSKMTNSDLLDFKEGLNKIAKSVNTGGVGSKKARVASILQKQIDDYLGVSGGDEYGDLTSKIGKSLALKKTYTNAAKKGTKIPFGIGSIPTGPAGGLLQSLGDKITRTSANAGGNIPLTQLMGQGATSPFRTSKPQNADGMPTSEGPIVEGEVVDEPQSNSQEELLKKLILAQALKSGKVTDLIAASKLISPQMDVTSRGRIQQMKDANSLVNQLESTYTEASQGGQTGFGVGPLAGILGGVSGGAINQEAALFNSLREGFTALIARATGEKGVLTDADAARALKLIPSLNDKPELAANKFNQIRQIFANAQANIGSTQPDNSDILSLLSGF